MSAPSGGAGPLSGLTVVDLSRILAGPFCTRILSDLGARVIKVEPPGAGDATRTLSPFAQTAHRSSNSAYFAQVNTGKESIALDLKQAADRKVLDQLLAGADVLVENYRPGVIDRLGYGWAAVHAKYPRVVMASISGFGQTGPMSRLGAVDPIIQGMSGIVSITGPQGDDGGFKVGASVSDVVAGVYAANGIQAALIARARTGKGAYVDISMLDCSVTLNTIQVGQYNATGRVPRPLGNAHSVVAPQDVFRCRDGTVMFIAASADKDFQKMCGLLDRPALAADPRFKGNQLRLKNRAAMKAELEAALAARTSAEWCDLLMAAQVPCGPVQDIAEVTRHPQVLARKMVMKTRDDKFLVTGNPIKISGYDDFDSRAPPPPLDADRARILARL